jgi:hypothetical protein
MAPLNYQVVVLMGKKTGENRDIQIKISGTQSLKTMIDDFVSSNSENFNSRNTLVDRAVRYLVKRYEEAGGRIDKDGFPLDVAADERHEYKKTSGQQQKRKHGSPS